MWKYLKGSKKPEDSGNNDKRKEYYKDYEKSTRGRVYLPKWEIGRPWLKNTDSGMICSWCVEFSSKTSLNPKSQSRKFVEGCTSYKFESISYHKKSQAHEDATRAQKSKTDPGSTPAA